MRIFVKINKESAKFRPDPKPEKKIKAKKPLSKYRKPTGEKALFEEIWNERGPYSQINNEYLGEFNICFFSHILPKGKYPKFRLKKQNVIIKSFDQHFSWEHQKSTLINNPEWKWIFELQDSLKKQYAEL